MKEVRPRKWCARNRNPFAKPLVAVAALLFLSVEPGLICAQNNPAGGMPTPHKALPVAQAQKDPTPADDFAGLTFTSEQKAQIDRIRQNTKSRTDAVLADEKLSPEQRDAMLLGYRRLETNEIFELLTPDQQTEVRKKLRARRAAAQQENSKQPAPAK